MESGWAACMADVLKKLDSLRKKRPLDLLRRGETQIVLDHAKSHAEDNTW